MLKRVETGLPVLLGDDENELVCKRATKKMAQILLINDQDIKIFGIKRIKQETKRMETKNVNIMWPPSGEESNCTNDCDATLIISHNLCQALDPTWSQKRLNVGTSPNPHDIMTLMTSRAAQETRS